MGIPPGRLPDSARTCTYCGEPYHGRCMHCHRPGEPYEYFSGITFDGLTAHKGEKLCRACLDAIMAVEGADILVVDDRPGMPSYVVNTVRDRDTVFIRLRPEERGIDGRDLFRRRRKS